MDLSEMWMSRQVLLSAHRIASQVNSSRSIDLGAFGLKVGLKFLRVPRQGVAFRCSSRWGRPTWPRESIHEAFTKNGNRHTHLGKRDDSSL
jgi:hypothetical protein